MDESSLSRPGFSDSEEFEKLYRTLKTAVAAMDKYRTLRLFSKSIDETYDRERGLHPDSKRILSHLNKITGRPFRETDVNLSIISARLKERGVIPDQVIIMLERQCALWKGTDMEQYLRPSTLFRASKFDNYYAARHVPVKSNKPKIRGTNI